MYRCAGRLPSWSDVSDWDTCCVQAAPLEPLGRFKVSFQSGSDVSGTTLPKLSRELPQPQLKTVPDTHTEEHNDIVPHLNSLKAALPAPDSRVNVSDVFWMTTVMAAACGLGAIPFFFIDKLSKGWAAMANAVACGVMIAASFDLLHEAEGYGTAPLILGLVTGCLFIKFMQDWLEQYEDVKFQDLRGADAHKILLFVGIMAAHAVGEGSGVGALLACSAIACECLRSWHFTAVFRIKKHEPIHTCSGGEQLRRACRWEITIALHSMHVTSHLHFQATRPSPCCSALRCRAAMVSESIPDLLNAITPGHTMPHLGRKHCPVPSCSTHAHIPVTASGQHLAH